MYCSLTKNEEGFTLIEVLVALAMSILVTAIIYSAYNTQMAIYSKQDKVADVQQNLRAGITILQNDARMAGFGRTVTEASTCQTRSGRPGIYVATATTFAFTSDFRNNNTNPSQWAPDGQCDDPGEDLTYSLLTNNNNNILNLNRDDVNGPGRQAVAEGITNLHFTYIFAPSSKIAPTSTPTAAQLNDIVAVQVSMLARSRNPDRRAGEQGLTFIVPVPDRDGNQRNSGVTWGPVADNFIRRMATTTITLRNIGLQ